MFSFFSVRLSSVGEREREREEICVCDKWWSCLRPPSKYTYTVAWHMPIIQQAKREERKDEWWQERKEMPSILSFSLISSDDDEVACRILSLPCCFLHTIIHVDASINCQSFQIDRQEEMINEGALILTRDWCQWMFYKYSSLNVKSKWIEREQLGYLINRLLIWK